MRLTVALLAVVFCTASGTEVRAQQTGAGGIESLGNELLEGLTPGGLPPASTGDSNNAHESNPARHAPRFDDLGEDIGQGRGPLSLARVRQEMQRAESLLATPAGNTEALQQASTAQKQVVDQLDKLIAELSKQCQGGQCQPSDQPPKPGQQAQKKPGKPKSATARGQTAARDSTDRLDQTNAAPVEQRDIEAMVKDLWGHLPERSREQMMQSFSEEFLPKYELEIEEYYRRLSEDDDDLRP